MKITTKQWKFLKDLCDLELTGCTITSGYYKEDNQALIDAGYIVLDRSVYKPTQEGRKQSAMKWIR